MQRLVSVQIHTYVQDPGSLNAPFERTKLERDTFNIAQSSHFQVFNISCTSCCVTQIFRASDSGLLVFKYNRSSVRQSGILPQNPSESQPKRCRPTPQQHSQVEEEEVKRVGRRHRFLPVFSLWLDVPAQAGPPLSPHWESQSSGSGQAKGKEQHKWERLATRKLS